MRAVTMRDFGGVEVLEISDLPDPLPGPGQLLVRVFATALNHADLLQRRGLYPPPPGESEILGLEFAGEVAAVGDGVQDFGVSDPVFGLLAGGGYAEFVVVDARMALPIPERLSFDAAAAIPEAFFTARENLFELARLRAGDTLLVHAGASGVGSAAIQLAKERGARVAVTAGGPEKVAFCRALGADLAIDYREEDFADRVRRELGEVDVVLDFVGAEYWDRHVDLLRSGGTLLVVGLLGGAKVEVNLGKILMKRLRILGSAMRGLPLNEKIAITERFREGALPLFEEGRLRPLIDRVFPLEDVREAHERMENNLNSGKIVLRL